MARKIYLLTTGGTISTRPSEAGAVRGESVEADLMSQLQVAGVEIRVREVMRKGSASIAPDDWRHMAEATAEALHAGADGVVILHGTDTMHYTASALTFMLGGLSVPVVLTGSMIPGGDPRSEAIHNLRDAISVAAYGNFAEVCIVFSADLRRSRGMIIRGCRARKIHSYAINAFRSINVPPIGYVEDGKLRYTNLTVRPREPRQLRLSTKLEPNVILVKSNPGLTAEILTRFLNGAAGAVIEGTGVGHVRGKEFWEVLAAFKNPVVISTQAIYGGQVLGMYAGDRSMLDIENIIPTRDMVSETALVKLMWALGQGGDVRSLMLSNLAGELSDVR